MTQPVLASDARRSSALLEGAVAAAASAPWLAALDTLKGAGPRTTQTLAAHGIQTVFDLGLLLPLRFEDKTRLTIAEEQQVGAPVFVEGEVTNVFPRFGRKRSWVVKLACACGFVHLRFFQAGKGFKTRYAPGTRLRCYGILREGTLGREIVHPQTAPVNDDTPFDSKLTPVYPRLKGIGQGTLRRLIARAIELFPDRENDDPAIGCNDALDFWQALRLAHGAEHPEDLERARRRLALDELLGLHLDRLHRRQWLRGRRAISLDRNGDLVSAFTELLPFCLTAAQLRASDEIFADMAQPVPMQRLLQGDVGCGKTVVAALAALRCVEAGRQVAMMAPTDLLAGQHYANLKTWFEPLGVAVELLTAVTAAPQRAALVQRLGQGEPLIVTGTHALFQQAISFGRLGLVVVDEQHRFGVAQRMALLAKGADNGTYPHMLIMSATPIPRTLAMTRYADLDVTTLDQSPANRKPIVTAVIPAGRRAQVAARIGEACAGGEQAYWVCPAIEDSGQSERESVERIAAALQQQLPGLAIEAVHGRMSGQEKASVMERFAAGAIKLLVATTVVEVGVDVPAATRIVIENAELMGLAQLHQLRGRVGRGAREGFCVLLYRPPLSDGARERLSVLRDCCDGFQIAQRDLALRGPGQFDGLRQSGAPPFKVADLYRDADLFAAVPALAETLLQRESEQARSLARRWAREAGTWSAV